MDKSQASAGISMDVLCFRSNLLEFLMASLLCIRLTWRWDIYRWWNRRTHISRSVSCSRLRGACGGVCDLGEAGADREQPWETAEQQELCSQRAGKHNVFLFDYISQQQPCERGRLMAGKTDFIHMFLSTGKNWWNNDVSWFSVVFPPCNVILTILFIFLGDHLACIQLSAST